MCPTPDYEKSILDLLATVQTTASRPSRKGRPSPKKKFDLDPQQSATRVEKLRAQEQISSKLNEHYDKAVAEIRASLERSQGGGG